MAVFKIHSKIFSSSFANLPKLSVNRLLVWIVLVTIVVVSVQGKNNVDADFDNEEGEEHESNKYSDDNHEDTNNHEKQKYTEDEDYGDESPAEKDNEEKNYSSKDSSSDDEQSYGSENRVSYEIDFTPKPSYIPDDVVVLTFDDGPDYRHTEKCLDVLREKNAKATFFINTENFANVDEDRSMQQLVRRMVEEGHELASHSAKHPHLTWLTAEEIDEQLSKVERVCQSIFGDDGPKITLFRAPFGEPYQTNNPDSPNKDYELVAPVVARHAVHIGWSVDSFDYNCDAGDSTCVLNNVRRAIRRPGHGSAYGVILMHSVHSQTCDALPRIIDHIRKKKFKIWTTEDVVKARFGKSSVELIYGGGEEKSSNNEKRSKLSVVSNFNLDRILNSD